MATRYQRKLHFRDALLLKRRLSGVQQRASLGFAVGTVLLLSACGTPQDAEVSTAAVQTAETYDEYDLLQADWSSRYVQCVREAGGDARVVGGSIDRPLVPGRSERGGLDAVCLDQVGGPPMTPPLSESFLAGLYELFQVQAECLRSAGYDVPEAPSRQEWVENYSGESWNPLGAVHASGRDVAQAARSCPQPSPNDAEARGNELGNR